MSACELTIELDRQERSYRAGEVISGQVKVIVQANCECEALQIGIGWTAHGKGNSGVSNPRYQSLGQESWTPGQVHRFPFQMTLPDGPASFKGEIFAVDWHVEARAELSRRKTPRTREPFDLVIDSLPRGRNYRAGDPLQPYWKPPAMRKTSTANNQVVFLLFGGALIFTTVIVALGDGSLAGPVFVVLAMIFLAGAGLCAWALRSEIAELLLGDVSIEPDRWVVPRGEELRLIVEVPRIKEAPISECVVFLTGRERCVRGHGRYQSVFTEEVHVDLQTVELTDPIHATFTIPVDGPLSFFAESNSVQWEAEVRIGLPWCPDFKRAIALDVVPAVGEVMDSPDQRGQPAGWETEEVEELGPVW